MKKLIYLTLTASLGLLSCSTSERDIVEIDLESLLRTEAIDQSRQEADKSIQFWENKLADDTNNIVYQKKIASLYASRFRTKHSIEDLTKSTKILLALHESYPNDVDILHKLASNHISQHAFKDAESYILKALALGEKKYASSLILIDILLERGYFAESREALESLDHPNRFDEQIRWVKLLDAEGDLDSAVEKMEGALANAQEMNDESLTVWSLSNLADMYGHQGRIQKSYYTHLEALALDPAAVHSIQAIGWIAYSHDKDLQTAKEIWSKLYELDESPGLALLLAEAYEMEGDDSMNELLLSNAMNRVSDAEYGNMYGSHLIEMAVESDPARAMTIAERDIAQRQHPVSYSYLALAELHQGNKEKAKELIKNEVLGRTGEPMALYLSGIVLHETSEKHLAKKVFTECNEAAFELGPSIINDVQSRYAEL